jgi:hypothetical protein
MRCAALPDGCEDEPSPIPRSYCGYTRSIQARDRQYMKKQSCAWRVLLVESALEAYFPAKNYKMRMFVVGFMVPEEKVEYAEAASLRCVDSEIRYGGFNVSATGQRSNAKGCNWAYHLDWRHENIPIEANTGKEAKRLDHPNYVSDREQAIADERYIHLARADIAQQNKELDEHIAEQQELAGALKALKLRQEPLLEMVMERLAKQ